MGTWLTFRLKVAKASLWTAIKVFNCLNNWADRLCEEAKQATGLEATMARRKGKEDEVEKTQVVCIICNHIFYVPESKYLPDVDCANCGASSPMPTGDN